METLSFPAVTAFYTAIATIIYLYLSLHVGLSRIKYRIPIGTGDNLKFQVDVRIHGNYVEYVPFTLFLIMLCEFQNPPDYLIHILGCTMLLARFMHIYGFKKSHGKTPGRVYGIFINWAVMLAAALGTLYGTLTSWMDI